MKGFVQYLWRVFTSLYVAYLAIASIAVAFFIWKHPSWEEDVGIGWGPFLVVLVFIICAALVLGVASVRLFTPNEDKNKFAGSYSKQGTPGRTAIISLVPGSDDWYTVEGGDWKGAGVLDGDRYYGIYCYKKTVDQHGTWGVHFGAFNAAAPKPFTFVRHDLHTELNPGNLDSNAFFWTKS
jgi:hypothetical protein